MLYNDFQDKKISALAMGCMRLPTKENFDEINEEELSKMVDYAMTHGVNYYDTAWGYHDGKSELAIGECLAKYPRESFYLTDKFPGYDLSNIGKVEEIFEKQLKKCQVEYFDFYLFHNVCELNINQYLDPQNGIFDYLIKQKTSGRIRHLGFSAHGSLEVIKRFLDAYGSAMEFCQLQINWLDWNFQNAKEKVALLSSYNIPVWVMEPVRGGALAKLNETYESQLRALRPNATTAEWAFRFLQSIPEVKVVLSGMSNFEQMKQNIQTFETFEPLNESERKLLFGFAKEMTGKSALPCTSCKYCTTHCPQGLNIPWLIELYNEHVYSGGGFLAPMALGSLSEGKLPSACIGCRSCEAVCPQNIKISEMMTDFNDKLK